MLVLYLILSVSLIKYYIDIKQVKLGAANKILQVVKTLYWFFLFTSYVLVASFHFKVCVASDDSCKKSYNKPGYDLFLL